VFHFSAGFKGGINRMARGPDGAIYLGEIGNPPNWGEYGKAWFGLERMQWAGNNAFEMLAIRVTDTGFNIELTQPLADDIELSPADLLVKQWFYHPNEQYGGPKYNETELTVSGLELSDNRRQISATIPGAATGACGVPAPCRAASLRHRAIALDGRSLVYAECHSRLDRRTGAG